MEQQPLPDKSLRFVLLPVQQLTEENTKRMYKLMEQSYNYVNYPSFISDLSHKNYAGILLDSNNVIQGFTTFGINPNGTGTAAYSILFSGDTVISPDYWGSQEMARGWGISVGKIIASDSSKKWYWFLLSKGHRTYMYLPLFFHDYYPSIKEQTSDVLKNILQETAARLYPCFYKPESGIIVFETRMGELRPELAQATFEKRNKPHVKLFLERNPGFHKGDELVCVAQLHPDNICGYGKQYIIEGMSQKLPLSYEYE